MCHISFIHLLMNTRYNVFIIPSLLWMMLQWGCTYFFTMISFPLDVYKEVGLLDHTIVLFLISWETSIVFSIVAEPIYIPTKSSLSSCSGQCLSALVFLVILTDVSWYLLVVWFAFSDDQWCWKLFHVFIGLLYVFWENGYLGLLLI